MKMNFRKFDLKLAHEWTIASTLKAGKTIFEIVLIDLTDSDGVVGLGESAPSTRYQENVTTVMEFLKKVDASRLSFDDVPGSMNYLESFPGNYAAKCAINIALVDGAARKAGKPVYDFLGLGFAENHHITSFTIGINDYLESFPGNYAAKCAINIALVDGAARKAGKPVYDFLGLGFAENHHITSFTIGIDTPEIIRKKVLEAEPYPVLKLKVGGPDDEKNMAALREAAPKKTVRIDANEGWKTKEEALRSLEWFARDSNIEFCEQPMHSSTPREEWVWLKARTPIPIFADESFHHAKDAEYCAECFHGVNAKLIKTGGISGAFDALKAARKLGLKTMIGCMIESSILTAAAAHLAELTNHLDIDGNILCTNDPYVGPTSVKGMISFAPAAEIIGLRVRAR